jgi:hypothetical protein
MIQRMSPPLIALAWISLVVAVVCSAIIAIDLLRRPQRMWIMNVVWPITALYAGPLAIWTYFRFGVASSKEHHMQGMRHGDENSMKLRPFPIIVAMGATHCGAGCTAGDLISAGGIVLLPALGSFPFQTRLFNEWIIDFILAYLLGIAFQYFTIAPMRHLSFGKGVWAAVKADTLSLTAWQLGMYGWMALVVFILFRHDIPKTSPVFWFMMQIAMLVGFLTSYPVNWWLIRKGLKEEM